MQAWLQGIYKKLSSVKKKKLQTSMKIIYWYGGLLVILTLLMVVSWLIDWFHAGTPNISSLLDIFKNYTATQVVAAITFISVFCVDTDGDGRPDAAQKQAENNPSVKPAAIPVRLENDKK